LARAARRAIRARWRMQHALGHVRANLSAVIASRKRACTAAAVSAQLVPSILVSKCLHSPALTL
jgi:hypothetical protein